MGLWWCDTLGIQHVLKKNRPALAAGLFVWYNHSIVNKGGNYDCESIVGTEGS